MSAEPFNIISGPANIWIAPFGEAFPAIDASVAGNFVSLGKTDGGVQVGVEQTHVEFMVDQDIQPVKTIRSEQRTVVSFTLTEITLERLAKLLDNQTVTDTAAGGGNEGHRSFTLEMTPDVPRWAMLVRGPSPYRDGNLQFELPSVVQRSTQEWNFTRDNRVLLTTEWLALADLAEGTAGKYGIIRASDEAAV